ncbi:MAG: Ycf66 family protein [Thermosynechococcaceae cyanobacterium]
MLTYVLVWMISLGSLGLYLIAYLFPEIHRKNDLIWGGVGLFYGLILAANAKTMPGGLLVGQIASVSLIFWLGQQMLSQRQLLVTEDIPRLEPGSIRDRIRTLVIQFWNLIEPLITLATDLMGKLLEKPQAAQISEIAVDSSNAEAKGSRFLNQLTNPLSNLTGNLTNRFKSVEKNREAVNTVTIEATAAPDDVMDNAVPQPETTDAVEELPAVETAASVVSAAEEDVSAVPSEPSAVTEPNQNENSPEPIAQTETVESPSVTESSSEEEQPVTEGKQPVEVVAAASIADTAAEKTEQSDTASDVSVASQPSSAPEAVQPETQPEPLQEELPQEQPPQEQPTEPAPENLPSVAPAEATSITEDIDVSPPRHEAVIKGGDLQPEEKPKEWNDPDPLA